MTWIVFNDLPAEDDIKTFIYGVGPPVSKDETKQEKADTELDGDEMDTKETNTEGHDGEEHKET